MKVLRKTRSVCPVCLEDLDAFVVDKENKVFLSKICPSHGQYEILLSRSPSYYKKLTDFYFQVMSGCKQIGRYEILLTLKCNINCLTCCFGQDREVREMPEPTCIEIDEFIRTDKRHFYMLSGGEPTHREDIGEIIKIFKKHRRAVAMNTNGLKLADMQYLETLKVCGLDRVHLQFDGFNGEAYRILRGEDLLNIKLKIIDNLKALNIQTILNVTIARNINDDEVIRLIDFATKNNFINGINFSTICYVGGARDWSLNNYIMPDELIDLIEEKTNHRITRKDILLFQKLHLAIRSFLSQKYCFYNQIYLLVRCGHSYKPINKFINLSKAEPWLERYRKVFKKSKVSSAIYLAIAILAMIVNIRSFFIIKELFFLGISYFFTTPRYLKNRTFISLIFSTGCDPYKVDYGILQNCHSEFITYNHKSKKLQNDGCDGLYCINLEKRHLLKQRTT